MSLPRRLQTFDAFLGEQSGIHSIILPDIFSSGGSQNVWMDRYARVRRILGFSARGAAVTTNIGGDPTLVRNYFPYRDTVGGGTFTRQVLGVFDDGDDEWELHFSTDEGATWTFIEDFGASSVGSIASFSQFGINLYIANGTSPVRKWDGTTLTNAGATQMAAPTLASAGTGNLSGSFLVKIVPRKSDGTRKPASVTSDAIALEGNALDITWVADVDPDVVGYEEYRSTGTGKLLYYVQFIEGGASTTARDNIEDITILENRVCEEHGDAPPQAYIITAHKQREFYFNTDAFPQRGSFSDPGNPESVYAENFIEFQDGETQGDIITGAVGNFESQCVVYQERSVWTVSGTGDVIGNKYDWNRIKTNCGAGSVSQRVIVKVPAGAKYFDSKGREQQTTTVTLAYLTPLKDIRLFDGDNDIIFSFPVSVALSRMNYAQRRKAHALHDQMRHEIAWLFASESADEPSTAVVWNYQWGVWYQRPAWAFSAAVNLETADDASLCLGGSGDLDVGGLSYKLWDTNFANGVSYRGKWMTKTLYGMNEGTQPAISFQKRFRWVEPLFEVSQNLDILVGWLEGDAPDESDPVNTSTISPDTEILMTSDGEVILTSDGDEIHAALNSKLGHVSFQDADGQYLHGSGIRIVFEDGPTVGEWSLEAFTLCYQILPGLRRRQPAALNP